MMRRNLWLAVSAIALVLLAAGNVPTLMQWLRTGSAALPPVDPPTAGLAGLALVLALVLGIVWTRRRRRPVRAEAQPPTEAVLMAELAPVTRQAKEQRLAQDAVRLLQAAERAAAGAGAGRNFRSAPPARQSGPSSRIKVFG